MNVLIIGSGGREHALTWKVAQSDRVKKIWVAPGNAGTAQEPKTTNVAISPTDIRGLLQLASEQAIHLTLVGPEVPLAAGIVDAFQQAGFAIFGPTQQAARLETSKVFCKNFLRQHGIPTARFATFRDLKAALTYIDTHPLPLVVKASGLAAGKGVIIAETREAARVAVLAMLEQKQFGEAGEEIVIEEFLVGEELSFIVMVDGEHVLPLASARDYKRRDNGHQGPNTGGMGAFSPVSSCTPLLEQRILEQIIYHTIQGLHKEQTPYVGFLYAGLMITPEGEPKVLEFNCRLGDPET
ncbi:MAG: phosphoribosylamine--glycine ligase, partial [Coxiella sp. RIFCSPHIGHO2_12_FULL_44_14]